MKHFFVVKENQDLNYEMSATIQKLMVKNGINEAELSRRTHIPQPTLHKILTGKTEDPRFSTLQQLASFFQLTVDEIANGITGSFESKETRINSIPIISWRDCVENFAFTKTLSIASWKNWISVENAPEGAFGIESTASAEPRFPRGTILIVAPNIYPKDGDLVIVKYKKAEEATLRELSIDGPNKFLISINPAFNKENYDETKKIVGVVIEYRFSYI